MRYINLRLLTYLLTSTNRASKRVLDLLEVNLFENLEDCTAEIYSPV